MGVGGLLEEADERPELVVPVVLAAGRASRMGFNKLAADLGGKPVIVHVVDAIEAAGLPQPLIVIGHDRDVVRDVLVGRDVHFVLAADHDRGLSQSLRAGVSAVPDTAKAAMILLGDMPFVSPDLLRRLAGQASEDAILVPRCDGRPGNPVLWGRAWFSRLTTLSGDMGARSLLDELGAHVRFIDCEDSGIRLDVDTPDALESARQHLLGAARPGNQTP